MGLAQVFFSFDIKVSNFVCQSKKRNWIKIKKVLACKIDSQPYNKNKDNIFGQFNCAFIHDMKP